MTLLLSVLTELLSLHHALVTQLQKSGIHWNSLRTLMSFLSPWPHSNESSKPNSLILLNSTKLSVIQCQHLCMMHCRLTTTYLRIHITNIAYHVWLQWPCIMLWLARYMKTVRPALKIAFCPQLRNARLVVVLSAASSYLDNNLS